MRLWHPSAGGTPLDLNLIPASATANLRTELPAEEWSRIRAWALNAAGHRCQVCGAGSRLEVHERWLFDDIAHVQRLDCLQVLCDACHGVVHTGRTMRVHGQASYGHLRTRWAVLNRRRPADFDTAYRHARRSAHRRDRHRWRLVVPELGVDRWSGATPDGGSRDVRRPLGGSRPTHRHRRARRWVVIAAVLMLWLVPPVLAHLLLAAR